ncbi:anaerobic ribonucleoside-triphosphate reductase activating protein [Roseateles cavernae]|uniref:anaerobic ribonucleoside-triphosphate reductase activating protein n=1 Tax=Roseateles cavernae TaxID=3153578 RepID=UPI0032E5017B
MSLHLSTAAATLRVGGLTPLTTIDFPGRLAAVVFLQGCPWRCSYCHNPGLLPADAPTVQSWGAVLAFLQRRRGLLDGVVFSGGEPTLQAALPAAIAEVRSLGFAIGLHSAGIYPERLAAVLPLIDWLGLDIKAPLDRIDAISGVPGSSAKVQTALRLVLSSGVAHECRTTWHPSLYPQHELLLLARKLAALGVRHWAVQRANINGMAAASLTSAEVSDISALFESFCQR